MGMGLHRLGLHFWGCPRLLAGPTSPSVDAATATEAENLPGVLVASTRGARLKRWENNVRKPFEEGMCLFFAGFEMEPVI